MRVCQALLKYCPRLQIKDMFMICAFIIFDIAICDINKYMLRSSEDKVLPTLGVGIRQIILINIITHDRLVR